MHAVVLTFPGHFFQTKLCVQNLLRHYPEVDQLTFVLDDVEADPWQTFVQDFDWHINQECGMPGDIRLVSDTASIGRCVAGWWRQQLVKLTLDQILPDSEWFVVDGDVVFDSRCEIRDVVPVSRRFDATSRWGQMSVAYVREVLGISQGHLNDQDQHVVTSPIPFRYLNGPLLMALRNHVQQRFGKDFVELHLEWFQDQTIVADINPPDRWVMTEWELIESFRRHVQNEIWPFLDVGSGYALHIDTKDLQQGVNLFRHSYQRDAEIGAAWFEKAGVSVDPEVWQRSKDWYDHHELQRRK